MRISEWFSSFLDSYPQSPFSSLSIGFSPSCVSSHWDRRASWTLDDDEDESLTAGWAGEQWAIPPRSLARSVTHSATAPQSLIATSEHGTELKWATRCQFSLFPPIGLGAKDDRPCAYVSRISRSSTVRLATTTAMITNTIAYCSLARSEGVAQRKLNLSWTGTRDRRPTRRRARSCATLMLECTRHTKLVRDVMIPLFVGIRIRIATSQIVARIRIARIDSFLWMSREDQILSPESILYLNQFNMEESIAVVSTINNKSILFCNELTQILNSIWRKNQFFHRNHF